jgi:hypothetical protein
MCGDKASHASSVACLIYSSVASTHEVSARKKISTKVRVWVHSAVDDGDRDTLAPADALCPRDIEVPEVPLAAADLVSTRRSGLDDKCGHSQSQRRGRATSA